LKCFCRQFVFQEEKYCSQINKIQSPNAEMFFSLMKITGDHNTVPKKMVLKHMTGSVVNYLDNEIQQLMSVVTR